MMQDVDHKFVKDIERRTWRAYFLFRILQTAAFQPSQYAANPEIRQGRRTAELHPHPFRSGP